MLNNVYAGEFIENKAKINYNHSVMYGMIQYIIVKFGFIYFSKRCRRFQVKSDVYGVESSMQSSERRTGHHPTRNEVAVVVLWITNR